MITATARTISRTYASLADVRTMRPLLALFWYPSGTFRRANKCVSYFTLRWDIIPHPAPGLIAGWADHFKGNVGVEKAPPRRGQAGLSGRVPTDAEPPIECNHCCPHPG